MSAKPWLRCLTNPTAARANLVCFPFSGGSAQAFASWAPMTPPGATLWGVQYPGRGDRFGEPFGRSVSQTGAEVADEIAARRLREVILLGHSLGGVIAYEAAVRLQALGVAPRLLIVSSCGPPGVLSHRTLHAAPDEEFWARLTELGGIDPQIADSPELLDLLAPILRSDLGLHARYIPDPLTPPLTCRVLSYQANEDPVIQDEGLDSWSQVTIDRFEVRHVAGDHFHAFSDGSQLVADVMGELNSTYVRRT